MGKRNPRRTPPPTHVLVLSEAGAQLVDRKGNVQTLTAEPQRARKRAGELLIVDMIGTVETTMASLPELTPEEIQSAVELTPAEFLPPSHVGDVRVAVHPTTDDKGVPSALIAYAPSAVITDHQTASDLLGLTPLGVEPAVVTATHAADDSGTVVLHSQAHQHVGLLMQRRQVLGRVREAAGAQTGERVDQLYGMITGLAGVIGGDIDHVILTGDADTLEAMRRSIGENYPALRVTVLGDVDLARLALTMPPLTPVQGHTPTTKRTGASGVALWGPLAAGLAAGLLPAALVTFQTMNVQRTLRAEQGALSANAAPLQEHADLTARAAAAGRVVQEADTILRGRVNWERTLTRVTDQLPEDAGKYSVRFASLLAKASVAPAPAAAETPDTQTEAPPPVPAGPPEVAMTVTAVAASRAAATLAISNLERTHQLNLQELSRVPGGWRIRGTLLDRQDTPEIP